jgi:phage shock protein PspC (stress-responsive transcriptional regulator)
MNDEAAESRGPSGPSQDAPAPSVPAAPDSDTPTEAVPTEAVPTKAEPSRAEPTVEMPTAEGPVAEAPTTEAPTTEVPTTDASAVPGPADEVPPAWTPPPSGVPEADVPPAGGPPPPPPPPGNVPPWMTNLGGPGFSRDKLVRPRKGRYVAGVGAALGRATNTDPVLWRVLLAVLGILSGVGVLLYLIGWLAIPAEGDTASPIESLLGKGRSGMAPLSVVVLGAAAVLSFAFIVHDGMRASVLAAAVILGAVLLIKRSGSNSTSETATFPAAGAAPGPVPSPAGATAAPTAQFTAPAFGTPAASAPAEEPVTAPLPPLAPEPPVAPSYSSTPPAEGYRPPFAPHGPWGPSAQQAERQPEPPRPPRPPRRRRERSKLGRLTFFAVVVVIGLMAVLDNAGANIAISAYFAAALVTIALGLILGAWFGRARGLIALALITTIGLGASTGAERYGSQIGNSVYRPASLAAVADRYDFTAGNVTLDLRDVTFTGPPQTITATIRFGQLKVLLPPTVDTTATVRLDNGRAIILGHELDDHNVDGTTVSDQGPDGAGGGTLKLDLQMDTGNLEVAR